MEIQSQIWNRIPNKLMYLLFVSIILFSPLNIVKANGRLPIVKISTSTLSNEFNNGHFYLDDTLSLEIDIKLRGASALSKTKKSFAIKFKDEQGESCDQTLLGMRSDNYWILDAMAIDVARMRNKVSMELWNDFSRKPYIQEKEENMNNGIQGKFVEVYLNEEYWGIYCLSERLDRKQLKLKKFKENDMRGILYKSFKWSTLYSTDSVDYTYDNASKTWNGWEISYPDVKDGETIDWKPLSELMYWLSYSTKDEITQRLATTIDMPVWQDYFLMMEFICADDNICKNQYVYYYNTQKDDRKAGVAPWDMDHSWGRDWCGKIANNTSPNFNLGTYHNRVCKVLLDNEHLLDKTFKERYAELHTTHFSEESLKNRFNTYFEMFRQTGAAQREEARWSGTDDIFLNFTMEQKYINDWIVDRLRYMDSKYDYKNYVSNIESMKDTSK